MMTPIQQLYSRVEAQQEQIDRLYEAIEKLGDVVYTLAQDRLKDEVIPAGSISFNSEHWKEPKTDEWGKF